jgi:predicted MFS family arabinose efflux permease
MDVTGTAATGTRSERRLSAYSWFALGLLTLIYMINYLDRSIVATLGVQIQDDLHISDRDVGRLGGLYFAIFYMTISVPVALLADRSNRVRIIAWSCFLFSLFTTASGVSRNFTQLVLARMGVGVGEAGGAPPSYSVISDYFPPARRGVALALFSAGVPFGQAIGVAFGAKVAAAYGWRTAFFSIGLVGIIGAALAALTIREPPRGRWDSDELPIAATASAPFWATAKMFFTTPTLVLAGLSTGTAAMVVYGMTTAIPQMLQRELHMKLGEFATYYSITLVMGMGLGGWVSGYLVDRLAPRNSMAYALVPALGLLLVIPSLALFAYAPNWPRSMVPLAALLFFSMFYLAPALTVVVNAVSPDQRTLAGALLLLMLNLIGLGLGPTLVGEMSQRFRVEHAGHSWQLALLGLIPAAVLSIVFHVLLALALRKGQRGKI